MAGDNHQDPSLASLIGKLARTGLGALNNRGELFSIEWQEERTRFVELFVWTATCLFLGMIGAVMLTAFIVFLFREDLRIYAVGGFALLYLAGAMIAWMSVKGMLKHKPFAESIAQVKKDALCLESLK